VNAHLVWDWNGTLLDDLTLVVEATNAALAVLGGPVVTADEHRRDFRRPVVDYYAYVLERPVEPDEFALLDQAFHAAYRAGVATCALTVDAREALGTWPGTQSLLSMYFHEELVREVDRHGLAELLSRVDGLPGTVGGHRKAEFLEAHLEALGLAGERVVLIGDSVDDAEAAATVGARCVLYAGGFTDLALLSSAGVPVAATLVEAVTLASATAAQPLPS
jgi:phosphoglycolate phosphatase-like HAD superfamily hydrolase